MAPEQRAIHPRNETSNGLFPVTDHPAEVLQRAAHCPCRAQLRGTAPGAPPSCGIAFYAPRRAEFCSRARKPRQKQAPRLLQGYFLHMTGRNLATGSQFRCITCGETTRHRPCAENTLRQWRARVHVVNNSCSALKYKLGKETKRDGFGLEGTHLFSRSIYLFIN